MMPILEYGVDSVLPKVTHGRSVADGRRLIQNGLQMMNAILSHTHRKGTIAELVPPARLPSGRERRDWEHEAYAMVTTVAHADSAWFRQYVAKLPLDDQIYLVTLAEYWGYGW